MRIQEIAEMLEALTETGIDDASLMIALTLRHITEGEAGDNLLTMWLALGEELLESDSRFKASALLALEFLVERLGPEETRKVLMAIAVTQEE